MTIEILMAKHVTERTIPVLTGFDYEHIMGKATISVEDDVVDIHIRAFGHEGLHLDALLTSNAPIAVSFVAVPVVRKTSKENR